MNVAFVLVMALAMMGCVPEPSDPVDYGEICVPASEDCPNDVLLARGAVGRNQLDYTVDNLSSDTVVVRVIAQVPESDDVDAGDEETTIIVEHEHRVPPNESVGNRWTAQDLGTRGSFEFSVVCVGCDARVNYVLTSVPLECVKDDDCSGGWFCDTNVAGRCVECRDDDDCSIDQSCDTRQGRCTPPESSGCAATDPSPSIFILLMILALGWRFRRSRSAPLLVVALALGVSAPADAAQPVASIAIGAGSRMLTGELGADTQTGVGLVVSQELRWLYFGGAVRLGTSYFLTDPDEPPYSKGLRTYSFAIGPRFYIPIPAGFEIVGGVDYIRLGLSSNSLVRETGTDTSFNAVGGVLGLRYRWSGLEARLESSVQPIFGLDGTMVTIDLAIALSAGI